MMLEREYNMANAIKIKDWDSEDFKWFIVADDNGENWRYQFEGDAELPKGTVAVVATRHQSSEFLESPTLNADVLKQEGRGLSIMALVKWDQNERAYRRSSIPSWSDSLRRKMQELSGRIANSEDSGLIDYRWFYYGMDAKQRTQFKEAVKAFAKASDLMGNYNLNVKLSYDFSQIDDEGNSHDFGSGSTTADALLKAISEWDISEELERLKD
jgi:hypothetical protein